MFAIVMKSLLGITKRIINLVLEWAIDHKDELMEDWELMRNDEEPKKIDPLV
jgi:hypothetical protein